jgi:MFS family permease
MARTIAEDAGYGEIAAGSGAMKMVVAASSAGTAFEWYDFFIFGTLTAAISRAFFSGVNETAGFIFALGAFGAGFAVRPFGALVFGWLGDRIGRKKTFIFTVSIMGLATIGIGLLPTYAQVGVTAPALLIGLRIVQGFALGGEYGGAAIYVAEHAPPAQRGQYTAWIQISASLGLLGALAVILITRKAIGEAAFSAWGWRIPFIASAVLLAVSFWMRAKLGESPAFRRMQAENALSKAPIAETFLRWRYLKIVLIALFSILIAQGAVWYLTFFYAQFFLEKVLKLDSASVNLLMIAVTVVSAPLYLLFGALSDRIGRKPVMLSGMIVAILVIFPCFQTMTRAGAPALAAAALRTPVTVMADPADCSVQFDPVGKAAFLSACDIAKGALANAGVSYANGSVPPGAIATVRIGPARVVSASAKGLPTAQAKAVKAAVEARIKAALAEAGYPKIADPKAVDWRLLFGAMVVLVIAAAAIYGPLGASLVELFPTRIRYTSVSLPYNIGIGWVGGFLSAVAFAMVAVNGNMFFGLWYPVAITILAAVITALFLPETKGRDLRGEP